MPGLRSLLAALLAVALSLLVQPPGASADEGDYPASVSTRTEVSAQSPVHEGRPSRARAKVGTDAGLTPTGTVTFSLDARAFAAVPLDRRGTAEVTVPAQLLTEGTHLLRASYLPSPGSAFQPSSGTAEIVVVGCRGGNCRSGRLAASAEGETAVSGVAAGGPGAAARDADNAGATDATAQDAANGASLEESSLPDTGGVWFWLLVLAGLALVAGGGLLYRSRSRT